MINIIFKKKKETSINDSKKVLGAYLPLALIEFITLCSIDQGISVVSIIERHLNDFKTNKEKDGIDINYLISSLIATAKDKYIEDVVKKKMIKVDKFFAQLRKELSTNISEQRVEFIINKVKEYAEGK
jgi:hypothetical protein